VEAQIHKVLDLGVNPTPGASLAHLLRGIASVWVCTLGPISMAFMILSFHCACDLWDADLPMDASGQEARHTSNEETRAWEEREIGEMPNR
jgi:hypothetical protein